MIFTDDQLARFQELHRNRYHKEISRENVNDQAVKLIGFVKILYMPISQAEYDAQLRQEVRMFSRQVRRAFEQYKKDQGKERPEKL